MGATEPSEIKRPAGSAEELQLQVLAQIRDSLTVIHRKQDGLDNKLTDVNVRVVRLEERDERLERAEKSIERLDGKVDTLLRDKDQRDGANNVFVGIRGWTPVVIAVIAALCSVLSGLYLAGRAGGVIGAPPAQHPSGERR